MSTENDFVPKIDVDQWNVYIDIQLSGKTNMFDSIMVEYLSGGELSQDEARYCTTHYKELSEYFGYNAHGDV